MKYLKACRACLSTEGKLEKVNEKSRRIFYNATELRIEPGDGLPQYFCAECYAYINKTMAFRRRSRRAHFVLKEIILVKNEVCQEDILSVNRKATNLVSPLTHWNPEKNSAYYYSTTDVKTEEDTSECDSAQENPQNQTEAGTEKKENDATVLTNVDSSSKPKVLNYMFGQTPVTILKTYGPRKSYNIQELKPSSAPVLQNENIMLLAQPSTVKKKRVYGEFVKEDSNVLNTSLIVADIKPDNWKEIEREEAEKRQRKIDHALKEIVADDNVDGNDDNQFDGYVIDEVHQEIDMNDIFKDLKEETADSDFEWPETSNYFQQFRRKKEPLKRPRKDKKNEENQTFDNNQNKPFEILPLTTRLRMGKALAVSAIKYINLAKQIEVHKARMLKEPFKSAKIKCQMCIKIFPSINAIQDHVKKHNSKAAFKHSCPVCCDRFQTIEQLQQHCALRHWYAYRCGAGAGASACTRTHYSLSELTKCWTAHETEKEEDPTFLNTQNKNLMKLFKIRPLTQERMGDSLKHWSDIAGALVGQPRGKYNCSHCKLTLGGLVPWKQHMQHHEKRPGRLECDICGITYSKSKSKLFTFHIKSRHMYTYTCKKCHSTFYNRNQALFHYARCPQFKVLPEEKKLTGERTYCNMCVFYTTEGLIKLYEHQLEEHGYFRLPKEPALHHPLLQCQQCKVYFCSKKYLAVHHAREGHGAVDSIDSLCLDCGETLEDEQALAAHKARAHPQYEEKRFKCEWCDKEFVDKWNCNLHIRETHQVNDTERLCELCGKIVTRSSFVSHRVRHKHSVPVEQTYRCRFCDHKSVNVAPYVIHVLFNHTLKPYCCTICGIRHPTRCEIREHILKNHAPCRPYECGECKRHFSHLDYLQDHCLKIHNVNIKKTNKAVFLAKQSTRKIFIYEHMKIDGSLIDENILAKALIEKCDYMEETFIPIDYKEAFFFDPTVDPSAPTKCDPPKRPKDTNYQTDEDKKSKPVKKKKKRDVAPTNTTIPAHTTIGRHETKENTTARTQVFAKTLASKLMNKRIKILPIKNVNPKQKITELAVTKETYHLATNPNDESQHLNATYDLKIETDSSDYKIENDEDFKVEQRLNMPDLNDEGNPAFDEEEVAIPKSEPLNEMVIQESIVPQEMIEESEDILTEELVEYKEEPMYTEEVTEEPEQLMSIEDLTEKLEEEKVEPMSTEDLTGELVEETVLTEDITGDLVVHEGQHYVLIDGLLYKLESNEVSE